MKKRITLATISLLLIALLIAPTACAPKKTTTTTPSATDQLQTRIASLESKVASQAEQISTLKGQVQNPQPAIDQLRAELTTLKTELVTLKTDNANLKTQNTDFTARIAKLEACIAELEKPTAPTTGTVDPEDAITLAARYPTSFTIGALTAGQTATITGSIRLTVENALAVAIKNVLLSTLVKVRTDPAYPDVKVSFIEFTGDLDWYYFSGDASLGGASYETDGSLKLAAGESKPLTIPFTIRVKNDTSSSITSTTILLSIKFYPEDYDVVK